MEKESPYLIVDKATGEVVGEIAHPPQKHHPFKTALAWLVTFVCIFISQAAVGFLLELTMRLYLLILRSDGFILTVLTVALFAAFISALIVLFKLGFRASFFFPEHILPSPKGLRYLLLSIAFFMFDALVIVVGIISLSNPSLGISASSADIIYYVLFLSFVIYFAIATWRRKHHKDNSN